MEFQESLWILNGNQSSFIIFETQNHALNGENFFLSKGRKRNNLVKLILFRNFFHKREFSLPKKKAPPRQISICRWAVPQSQVCDDCIVSKSSLTDLSHLLIGHKPRAQILIIVIDKDMLWWVDGWMDW